MHFEFDQSAPLYQQLADQLAEMIFTGIFKEGEQVPSTTQLSQELNMNPATILKGMNQLVDQHLLEKRRGRGMFVLPGAPKQLAHQHREAFYQDYVASLVTEAQRLGIDEEQLLALIKRGYQNGKA